MSSLHQNNPLGPSILVAVVLVGATAGCTALRITHSPAGSAAKTTPIEGVPFYPKKGACQQQVVWLEPIYNLSLATLVQDKNNALQSHPRGAVALSRTAFQKDEVRELVKLLNEGKPDEDVLKAWAAVVANSNTDVLSRDFSSLDPSDRILVGRLSKPTTFVDYSDQYYANARVPLAGSASVNPKVAADGSLTEISAQVQDNTLQTILGALPISTVLTGALGLPGKGIVPTVPQTFQLTITITGYQHTLGRTVPYANPCPLPEDLNLANATEYKRDDVSAAAKPSTDDKTSKTSPSANPSPADGSKTTDSGGKQP
jgi:hypothetical protein